MDIYFQHKEQRRLIIEIDKSINAIIDLSVCNQQLILFHFIERIIFASVNLDRNSFFL